MTVPLTIEFAGVPGSGKTSLSDAVAAQLRKMGYLVHTTTEAARPRAAETGVGKLLVGIADSKAGSLGLWWLFYAAGVGQSIAFGWQNRRSLREVARYQASRPISPSLKAHIAWWYMQLGGRRRFLDRSESLEAILYDDGFLHRSVALFASHTEPVREEAIRTYIRSVPMPDTVVRVLVDVHTCTERVLSRGIWPHSKDMTPTEVKRYLENAEHVLEIGLHEASRNGVQVIEAYNGRRPLATVADALTQKLSTMLTASKEQRA